MAKKAHPAVARDQFAKRVRKAGRVRPLPPSLRGTPPVVTWRVRGCRCLVLSVYLTPDGWALDGRDFTVPMAEWIARTQSGADEEGAAARTLDGYRAGHWAAFSPREIAGISKVLSLDVDLWEPATFELGCEHGHGHKPLADLAADCRKVRATRAPVRRPIAWDG